MDIISSSFLGLEAVMLVNASLWTITLTITRLHRIPLMEDLPEDFLLVTTMPKACMQTNNIIQPRYNYQTSPSKYILTHPMRALELFLEQYTGCLHLQLVCAFHHSCPQWVLWPPLLLKLHQFPEVLITPKTKICLRYINNKFGIFSIIGVGYSDSLKLVVNKLHYYRLFLWYGIQLQSFHLRPIHPKHHNKISLTTLPPKQISSILKLMLRFLHQIFQPITTLLLPQQHI